MKRQGISLITLVITIVIVIILAGAVILNLTDKNPIKDATKAVVIEDIDTFRTDLMLKLTTASIFDTKNINAVTKDDILKYIPSMENGKIGSTYYTDILVVSEGQLKVDGTKANEAIESKKLTQEQYDWIVEALGGSVFNAQTYSIKYYANDGTENFTESSKIHNVKYSILANTADRENYGFIGWNTKADGTGIAYNVGDEYTENAELTLYAQWKANTFTITYYKNDGTEEAKTEVKNADVAYVVANQDFTRTGYSFLGWNTAQDGTGTNYALGASYTANENVTLYAIWGAQNLTAAQVKAEPKRYYGTYVNYIPGNGCPVKWRVFYADGTNIYLIAEDYVENKYITSTGLKKSTYSSAYSNCNVYCVYSRISGGHLVATLKRNSDYTEFKDNAGKASSVVGAPTLEMYKDSYNAVNTDMEKQMNILNCKAGQDVTGLDSDNKANAEGYVIRFGNTGNYAYDITIPTDANKKDLYVKWNTDAPNMWLASQSAYASDCVMVASDIGTVGYNWYNNDVIGIRPLVMLNSGVKLVDPDGDGVYDLQ